MATAFDDPHSELRNAQARFALQRAHAKLQGGDPVGALQDLLNITRQVGGDDAQTPLLQRVLDAFQHGRSPAVDDLTALLAQCNIQLEGQATSTQQSSGSGPGTAPTGAAPILAESGREGITDAALSDGSSYVCPRCHGVVSRSRERSHNEHWCSGA